MTRTGTPRSWAAGLVVVTTLGLVAGCGAGGSGGGTASSVATTAEGTGAQRLDVSGKAPQAGAPTGLRSGGSVDSIPVQTKQVIATGRVTLESKDLARVRDDLDQLLGRYGGFVSKEQTSNDTHGTTTRSVLQLRVPSEHFDELMSAFSGFSTVIATSRNAVDVTTEVIDVAARIRTAEVSLRRLRGFLGRAHNVDAIIRLESDIAEREAELSSLESQQRYLHDQTSLATVTVTMTLPRHHAVPIGHAHATGFLAGLRGGWTALVQLLLVVATVLGAVLPFVVVVALVGGPVWWWLRLAGARRRRTGETPAEPA